MLILHSTVLRLQQLQIPLVPGGLLLGLSILRGRFSSPRLSTFGFGGNLTVRFDEQEEEIVLRLDNAVVERGAKSRGDLLEGTEGLAAEDESVGGALTGGSMRR